MSTVQATPSDLAQEKPRCQGTRTNGEACSKSAWKDGYCKVHHPTEALDLPRYAAEGGRKSGELRRARAVSLRVRMVERFEQDKGTYKKLVATFADALEAFAGCPECGASLPDHRARVDAATKLLAELYGKPVQPTEERGAPSVLVIHRPARSWQVEGEADEVDADPPPSP